MTATEQKMCPICDGDQAFTLTDIGYSKVMVCPECVAADAPPPDMYYRILAAIRREEANIAAEKAGKYGPEPEGWRGDARGGGRCIAALLIISLGILTIAGGIGQIAGWWA